MATPQPAKRGHWTKGKRRHPGSADAQKLILLAREEGHSWRDISLLTGRSVRSIRHYADGHHFPSPRTMARLRRRFGHLVEPRKAGAE